MGRGMNMEQFREALSSDATIENEKLRKKLEELRTNTSNQIEALRSDVEHYKKQCIQLANRCFVYSKGDPALCLHCDIDCCKYAFTEKEMEAAVKKMTKEKMPRNSETAIYLHEYLCKLRAKRLKEEK